MLICSFDMSSGKKLDIMRKSGDHLVMDQLNYKQQLRRLICRNICYLRTTQQHRAHEL